MAHSVLKRRIGSSDVTASAIGLGTWAIGGWLWGGTDEANSIKAIQAGIDSGITLIDTAPAYGLGKSEELVGKAIKGKRDKVVLSTKCGLVWHTDKGLYKLDQAGKPIYCHLGAASIRYEVEQSLKRLNTDYIDHYLTHWPDKTTPIEETLQMLLQLKQEGKIRSIGASNLSQSELQEYISAGGIDAVQEKYSMLDREIETTLLPICAAQGMSCLSYSPLALGLLSGKIGPDRVFNDDDLRAKNPRFQPNHLRQIKQLLEAFRPIADRHQATLAQVVIAWTIRQPGITFALCGARTPEQAIENAQASQIMLTREEIDTMNGAIDYYQNELDGPQ
nr:aldo/keto reductase [uncultured Cohaesibacter sp.]